MGTHMELLSADKTYAQMWRMQQTNECCSVATNTVKMVEQVGLVVGWTKKGSIIEVVKLTLIDTFFCTVIERI